MSFLRYGILFILSIFFLQGCGGSSLEQTSNEKSAFAILQSDIKTILDDPRFDDAHWGIFIKSLETDEVWFEQNADKLFMPASNEKIITGAAALETLGPDFSIETTLSYTGNINKGYLDGDLIVTGYGDPTLYSRFYDSPTTVFKQWADSLKALGIHTINGNIIGDDNAFDDERLGYGWTHSGLDVWYSAEIGPLTLNENYIDLRIVPPAAGNDSVQIIPNLLSSYYKIVNVLTVTDSGFNNVSVSRLFGTNTIVVSGTVKAGSSPFERSPSIYNPTAFYVTVLKEELERNGIKVFGKALDCDDINEYSIRYITKTPLLRHHSPPMKDLLSMMMKRSQNLYAEIFPRLLALQAGKKGSFYEGKKVVETFLAGLGIDPERLRYMDGSGLSRYNYVTPYQLSTILEAMYESDNREYWLDAMPIAGVDGTLRNRMKESAAMENVRAKTGTISNVRGLSGYVTTAEGEQLVFSFLVNGHLRTSKETEEITDRILILLAEYPKRESEISAAH